MKGFGFYRFFFQFTIGTICRARFEFEAFGPELIWRYDFTTSDTEFGRRAFHRDAGTYDHKFTMF